jgi:hypothetical protein
LYAFFFQNSLAMMPFGAGLVSQQPILV